MFRFYLLMIVSDNVIEERASGRMSRGVKDRLRSQVHSFTFYGDNFSLFTVLMILLLQLTTRLTVNFESVCGNEAPSDFSQRSIFSCKLSRSILFGRELENET